MTHAVYTYQQLQHKSIARLKQIYSEIACTVEVTDKRCKDSWITAIADYQSSKIQKLTPAAPDNQALAQAELDNYITDQAQAIAPEPLRIVEISFDHHEYYTDDKLVASISHDDNLTQPWVVMLEGVEKFRANTWARCHRFIQWHLNNSQLPSRNSQLNSISKSSEFGSLMDQSPHRIDNCELRTANCELLQDSTLNETAPTQPETPCTTENLIMAHIFNECQNYGFEILDDGIYNNNGVKLGQVGCTNGNWWVILGCSGQQQYSNSVLDAVRSLSMVDTSLATEASDEYLQYRPLEQLTTEELQHLLSAEATECEQLLDHPVDELTSKDWERLREYEPHLELVTA